MEEKIKLNYYYGDEPDKLCFYRIPKALFTKACFEGLSTDAKVLYGLLLDHMTLSRENRWVDDCNRVYIIYSVQRACAFLNCKKDKAMKLFAELDEETGFGLIERVKRGLGKADIIYVKNFDVSEDSEEREAIKNLKNSRASNNILSKSATGLQSGFKDLKVVEKNDRSENKTTSYAEKVVEKNDWSGNQTSGGRENRLLEVGKTDPNKNNMNNNNNNNKYPVSSCLTDAGNDSSDEDEGADGYDSSSPIILTMEKHRPQTDDRQDLKGKYISYIKKQIDYDALICEKSYNGDIGTIDGIVNIIADVAITTPPDNMEWVNSRPYNHEIVKSHLLKVNQDSIRHVLDNIKKNTTSIRKHRAYLMTALYNAVDENDFALTAQVNHDMYGGGWVQKGVM